MIAPPEGRPTLILIKKPSRERAGALRSGAETCGMALGCTGATLSEFATLSHRRRLRFWGWGYEDEDLSPEEVGRIRASAARAIGHAP